MAQRSAVFWDVHSGMHREGPGSAQSTERALELALPAPIAANVLDIACGPGAETLDLARLLPEATISAIDSHQPFVDEANRRAPKRTTDAQGVREALTLKAWLGEQLAKLPRSSETAEAIRYGLNHWQGLSRFLDDDRIEIDTNTVERSIRPIALNRKNVLFAGSDEGGANWAIVASLIETALCRAPNYAECARFPQVSC